MPIATSPVGTVGPHSDNANHILKGKKPANMCNHVLAEYIYPDRWLSPTGAYYFSVWLIPRRDPHSKIGGFFIMSAYVRSRFFTAVVATGLTLPLWVTAATDALHKAVYLGSTATVAGKTLQAGDYDLVVKGNQAKFERNGTVVAEVACTWKTLPAKSDHDRVDIDHGAVTEIQFKGNTQAIDF
jgi:hypothetical protein